LLTTELKDKVGGRAVLLGQRERERERKKEI